MALPTRKQPHGGLPHGARDLRWVAGILWLTALARVAVGVAEGEVFHTEATLALACVVGLPWVWGRA